MQPQNSSDSILVLWYVTEKCDFLIRVSFKRRSAGSSMVASVLSMAKTISRPIPSRLWNQFKLIINCTHFCPIIRRVPKKISQLYHRTPLHGRPLVIRDRFCCPGEMSSYEDDALFLQFFRLWLHQPSHLMVPLFLQRSKCSKDLVSELSRYLACTFSLHNLPETCPESNFCLRERTTFSLGQLWQVSCTLARNAAWPFFYPSFHHLLFVTTDKKLWKFLLRPLHHYLLQTPLHFLHATIHPNLSFPYVLCCSAWLHIPLPGCLNLHSMGSRYWGSALVIKLVCSEQNSFLCPCGLAECG